jgi:hypothetical protein
LAASLRAAVTVVVSDALGELAREEGSEPVLVPLAADSFPAPAVGETVVAVSLGHLGHRTDWALLREVTERMPELILLLIGAWHEQESGGDPDFQALRGAANVVWLGRRTVSPDLKGVRTWERAVTVAGTPEEWIAALRAQAGVRTRPDAELREWALAQTARTQNRPLWERMEALGIESGRLGSERLSSG